MYKLLVNSMLSFQHIEAETNGRLLRTPSSNLFSCRQLIWFRVTFRCWFHNNPSLVQIMAWRRTNAAHMCRRMYASLGLNELMTLHALCRPPRPVLFITAQLPQAPLNVLFKAICLKGFLHLPDHWTANHCDVSEIIDCSPIYAVSFKAWDANGCVVFKTLKQRPEQNNPTFSRRYFKRIFSNKVITFDANFVQICL